MISSKLTRSFAVVAALGATACAPYAPQYVTAFPPPPSPGVIVQESLGKPQSGWGAVPSQQILIAPPSRVFIPAHPPILYRDPRAEFNSGLATGLIAGGLAGALIGRSTAPRYRWHGGGYGWHGGRGWGAPHRRW